MKKMISIILIIPAMLFAQATGIDNLLNNPDYLVGLGEVENFEQADEKALANLSQLISVSVQSSFIDIQRESGTELSEFTEQVIKTYSAAIINGAERKTELKGNKYRVIRYILKADKNKIFAEREAKILEYVKTGIRAEDVNNFDIALRNYYWALILLRSHPNNKAIYFKESVDDSVLLTVFLPDHIRNLLREVRLKAENFTKGENNYVIYISAENNKGKISNLNLKYYDGAEFIPASLKDGKGAIFLPRDYFQNIDAVTVIIDYEFKDLLGSIPQDEEVKLVSEYVLIPRFDNQKKMVHPVNE